MYKRKIVPLLEKYFNGKDITYKQVFGIILPILTDQTFLVVMSMLNVMLISSDGVASISSVSMVDSLNLLVINMFVAISTGGTVIISQYYGTRNGDMVKKTANQLISFVFFFSLILSVLLILFHSQVLSLLFGGADEEILEKSRLYFIGSCISYPFIGTFQSICSSLIGIGQTKSSLKLSLLMNLTNTILNVVLITFLHMGIMGLVISVIISRALGMIVGMVHVIKFNPSIPFKIKTSLKFDVSILKKIMFIGIPFMLEQVFFNGGKLLTQTFIVQLGTMALAANAVCNSLMMFHQIGPNTLSISIVTIVGQCLGRKNIKDARKFVKSFLGLSTFFFIGLSFIIFPFFPLLMKLFQAPNDIQSTILLIMVMSTIGQILFWSISFIVPSGLRAGGDVKFTSITSMLSMWLFRVILGYVLGITLGYGIIGIWAAMLLEWGIRSLFFWRRFKGDKWYQHKLI